MFSLTYFVLGEFPPFAVFEKMKNNNDNKSPFLDILKSSAQIPALRKMLSGKDVARIHLPGLTASSAALTFSFLRSVDVSCPCLLFILPTKEEAGYFRQDMEVCAPALQSAFFPSPFKRAARYGQKDAASEVLRCETLSLLEHETPRLAVVTYPEALSVKVAPRNVVQDHSIRVGVNDKIDMRTFSRQLESLGFKYVEYVYEPGEYALRGSIIDVFSYASDMPYRIDCFGDDVDSIRSFEVDTQLSSTSFDEVIIVPETDTLMDSGEMVSALDYFPKDTLVFVKDLDQVLAQMDATFNDSLTSQAQIVGSVENQRGEEEDTVLSLEGRLQDRDTFLRDVSVFRTVEFGLHPFFEPEATLRFSVRPQPLFHKNFDMLLESFQTFRQDGYRVFVTSDSLKQIQRLEAIFQDRSQMVSFQALEGTLHEGFVDDALKICLFTDHQIFDRFHKYSLKNERTRSGKIALTLKELKEFQIGDYVVHMDHGIGRFGGLMRIPMGEGFQEVIKIIYQNDDVVFVSIHALHKVSKYRGKEGDAPRISTLGTGAWEKMKDRTKKKVKDIARELIRLYAARRQEKGFAFPPDDYMQHELEASFIYEDTPDQSKATMMVKKDMESNRPMDRLVCGDVGFGKTEVAVRAAFKAVLGGKQVAVLVPTTVLSFQHFNTFKDRLSGMPVRVDYLSRARSAKDQKALLKDLAEGGVNIIIGTQRLLGKDVRFKDLGLLVIDEEQKFGVAVKERLRQMRVNVDTLTLTATPIPRTLQFSLMGARDLSVIQTPPPNRYPIQTEVRLWDAATILDAVNFEMSRNGQVFYVCNRISGLEQVRSIITKGIPDCRVAIGHGQMDPQELEKVVFGFINHDYDVLVSTTIVENGVDIPNANTIIIQDAHQFGLSDLHQMRGRVGRSNKKAFCYLIAPPLNALPKDARRRLEAVESFSELGSGIQIAMQDLDIRGAGNLLGAEQSGFIADLGYETYQKVLTEAVRELKADEFEEVFKDQDADERERVNLSGVAWSSECQIESDLELMLPATYVTGDSERMLLYRELDGLTSDEQVDAFRIRLKDRFGRLPKMAEDLLMVVPLRLLGMRLNVERIVLKSGRMILNFSAQRMENFAQSEVFGHMLDYAMGNSRRCEIRQTGKNRSILVKNVHSVSEGLDVLRKMAAEEPKKVQLAAEPDQSLPS